MRNHLFTLGEVATLRALVNRYADSLRESMRRPDLTHQGVEQYRADVLHAEVIGAKLDELQRRLSSALSECDE